MDQLNINFSQRCFPDKPELQDAVDACADPDDQEIQPCLDIQEEYGWPMGTWCVSLIRGMENLFFNKITFNEDLSGWDVSSVITMRNMFERAENFNSDISNWDVSSVTDMNSMFREAEEFNQNLCAWGNFPNFPYDEVDNMFEFSGCDFQDDPQNPDGPFCAVSECN